MAVMLKSRGTFSSDSTKTNVLQGFNDDVIPIGQSRMLAIS
jgi:hypothetical protein